MDLSEETVALATSLSTVCREGHLLLTETLVPSAGKFESETAALSLAMIAVRHAEGVAICSSLGPSGFSPMAACARAALETGVTGAWIMNGADEWEREGRWLGYHKAHSRYWRNIAAIVEPFAPSIAQSWRAQADIRDEWRSAVEGKLPAGRVVSRPSVLKIMAELQVAPLYLAYRLTSQVVHGEPPALDYVSTRAYVRADPAGTQNVFEAKDFSLSFGDFVTREDWTGVFKMASFGVARGCGDLALVRGAPAERLARFTTKHFELVALAERLAPSHSE